MKSYEGTEPYLFVSYAHTDTECIIPILEELDKLGYRFWFDEGIYSGDEWREVVASHLLGSKIVLAFISSDFCESKNCKDEINLAHEHVTIIPVYIDSTENPTYLSAGMLMSLSGYNAIYAGDYFKRSNKIDLIERICNSPDVRICKLMSVGVTKHKECFDSAFLFSKEFLHSGALSIQDHPIEKIKEEVSKLSRLFDSIFYLKHFETRTPSDNIADTIINIIKENIYSFRKNLLKIKGPLGSYKNRLLQYIYLLLEKEDNGIMPFYIDL